MKRGCLPELRPPLHDNISPKELYPHKYGSKHFNIRHIKTPAHKVAHFVIAQMCKFGIICLCL